MPVAPAEAEEEVSDESEPVHCPVCGGEGGFLGALGWRQHFCCRSCGMQFSHLKNRDSADGTKDTED